MAYEKNGFDATPLDQMNEQGNQQEPNEIAASPAEVQETGRVEATAEQEKFAEETSAQASGETEPEMATVEELAAPREKGEAPTGQDDYSQTFRSLSEGDLVDGVVVHIDKDSVLVDVGTKSEGVIRLGELAQQPVESPEEVVSVGDRINVYVMETDSQDGGLILSKKRADFEKAWERVIEAYEQDKPITAMVTDRVKGGLVVDLGVRGFVPGSHVGSGNVKNLDRYVGQSLPLKVIEVDKDRRKVILSHKEAVESERQKRREETLRTLAEGQIREGVVRRITDYGAFVDLGGVDGLLHISEMSWTRIDHPSQVVKPGQKIQVMVLKLDLPNDRISLGLRQILPDPWASVESRYSVGDVVTGKISRIVPFGAFVRLEEGIEGIIPNVELSRKKVKRAEDVVSVGDEIEAKVIDLSPEERRMTLSIRQVQEEKDKEEYETYRGSANDAGRTTLADLVGDKLKEFRELVAMEAEEESRSRGGRRRKRRLRKAEKDEHEELDMIEEPVEEIETARTPKAEEGESAPEGLSEVAESEQTAGEAEAVQTVEGEQVADSGQDQVAPETELTESEAAVTDTTEELS